VGDALTNLGSGLRRVRRTASLWKAMDDASSRQALAGAAILAVSAAYPGFAAFKVLGDSASALLSASATTQADPDASKVTATTASLTAAASMYTLSMDVPELSHEAEDLAHLVKAALAAHMLVLPAVGGVLVVVAVAELERGRQDAPEAQAEPQLERRRQAPRREREREQNWDREPG
jgi:hypothetical protein